MSYEDLLNVVRVQCASFQAACCRLELLPNDIERQTAFREYFHATFVPLSQFSATVLDCCRPT